MNNKQPIIKSQSFSVTSVDFEKPIVTKSRSFSFKLGFEKFMSMITKKQEINNKIEPKKSKAKQLSKNRKNNKAKRDPKFVTDLEIAIIRRKLYRTYSDKGVPLIKKCLYRTVSGKKKCSEDRSKLSRMYCNGHTVSV
jgi:hypothetical protein